MEKLTDLERAALLKKAGTAGSLLEARAIHLQEMDGVYDVKKSPEGEWDNRSWYGGPNSGGHVGHRGHNTIHRVVLSGRSFVVFKKEVEYRNGSSFMTNHDRDYPDGNCGRCGTFYYVFASEGPELDAARVSRGKLEELLKSAEKHLPEALDIFREEYVAVK